MATGRGAKPIDAAQASLRELCSVLESSESTPALVTRNVLVNLGMVDEVQELDAAMADDVKNAERLADGEAGNSVKYEALTSPKWAHHTFRCTADRMARDSAAETGATKDDIDDLFGWLQAERAKDQQKAYAGIAERSVRARCTMMI